MTHFCCSQSVLRKAVVCLWLIVVHAAPSDAQTAPRTSDSDWHFRYELFQMLLEQNGLQPSTQQDVLDNPGRSVIVKLGNPRGFPPPRYIETYCHSGGRVLLATDTAYSAGRLCEFNEAPVETPELVNRYQNYRDCLKLTNLNVDHPLTTGVGSIVVNRSGWLSAPARFSPDWNIAATLPRNCVPRRSSRQPVLATIDDWSHEGGQLILAADPSLFTNGMLWHGDNAILAINISRLLADGQRDRLIFLVDDRQQSSYRDSPLVNTPPEDETPPLPENLPEPELQTMLRVANSVVKNVEESNVLNEALTKRPRNMTPPYYNRLLLFILAALALLFIVWKLTATGPVTHPTMPIRDMKSAHALTSDQKTKSSELGLSASMLAREFCRDITGSSDPAIWQRTLADPVGPDAAGVQNKSLQKQIAPVLSLAINTRTVHISRRRLESIGQTIIELRKLHKEGELPQVGK